jgi:F0F1-type ATP synthase assembly protein I
MKNEKRKKKKEKRKKKKRQMGTTQATHLSAEVVRSIISFDRPASLP